MPAIKQEVGQYGGRVGLSWVSEGSQELIPIGIWPPGGRIPERWEGGFALFGKFSAICLDMYVGSWDAAPKEFSHVELMLA